METPLRSILIFLLVTLSLLATPAIAQETPAPAEEPSPPAAEVDVPGDELTARSTATREQLDKLRPEIEQLGDVEDLRERIAGLSQRVDEMLPDDFDPENPQLGYAELDSILSRARSISADISRLSATLADQSAKLEDLGREVTGIISSWTTQEITERELPPALRERIDGILELAGQIKQDTDGRLNAVVTLQNEALAARDRLGEIERALTAADQGLQSQLLVLNAPPLWRAESAELGAERGYGFELLRDQLARDVSVLVAQHVDDLIAHLVALPFLLLLMLRLRYRARQREGSGLDRPYAMAILLWWLLGIGIYVDAPLMVRIVISMGLALSAASVLLSLVPRELRPGVLVVLSLFLLERLLFVVPTAELVPRILYLLLAASMASIGWLAAQPNRHELLRSFGLAPTVLRLATSAIVILSLLGAVLNGFGYTQLGKLFISGVIRSSALFLVLFTSIRTLRHVLGILLEVPSLNRIRSISRNRRRLENWLQGPLVLIAWLIWIWGTLEMFDIGDLILGVAAGIFAAELSVGEFSLSLQGVFTFLLAIWLAVAASRIVRSVLDDDVLPRMHLPRGIPHTISTIVHYVIVIVGLMIGGAFLGIDLSSLAFIVGAVGVGVGFGLQNLVNNFVSGLILIFERPIQVGDTVEVGTLLGRVTNIGIRTSRVRTYSGSEVIVPNGDLASNQVINWTLSDRRRRLEFVVGVAYGTDPAIVTELLKEVADNDEALLKDPAPIVVFEEFGDSSLNFRLYAWIGDFEVGFSTRHRVTSAINNALLARGIVIPFPQRDLHLISTPGSDVPGG
jgi:small-conductance mechanosensitive channel